MIQFNDIYDKILESKAKDKRISNIQYMEGYIKIISSNENIYTNAFIITLTEDYQNKQFLLQMALQECNHHLKNQDVWLVVLL